MIEEKLLTALHTSVNREKLQAIGIPSKCLPPITRGFPQLIGDRDPDYPKGYFCDLPSLKRQFIDKALLHLYRSTTPHKESKIVILTWVIGDGFGDYSAQLETAKILSSVVPNVAIALITLISKDARFPRETSPFKQYILRYRDLGEKWNEIACESLSPELLNELSSACLILQIPTYYPNTHEIIPSGPKYELFGEGGWLDSPRFNPHSGARCMGLHYLEKGIYIKEMPSSAVASKQLNKRLSSILFGELSLKNYLHSHSFNCAYTYPEGGLYLYIHTLLKSLEDESMQIDIALFDLTHLLNHMQALYFPLFKKTGVKEVVIHFQETRTSIPVAPTGKMVRLIHLDTLSNEECLAMVAFSDRLVGCKADGSISEAVSANKPFFLDPPRHKLELIRDLIALTKHYLPNNTALLSYLELFLSYPNNRLIEERALLSFPFLQEIGEKMGSLLKDPSVSSGMLKLCHILQSDYAVNPVLQNLTLRALTHKAHPHIELLEKDLLDAFLHGDTPLHEALAGLKDSLSLLY